MNICFIPKKAVTFNSVMICLSGHLQSYEPPKIHLYPQCLHLTAQFLLLQINKVNTIYSKKNKMIKLLSNSLAKIQQSSDKGLINNASSVGNTLNFSLLFGKIYFVWQVFVFYIYVIPAEKHLCLWHTYWDGGSMFGQTFSILSKNQTVPLS